MQLVASRVNNYQLTAAAAVQHDSGSPCKVTGLVFTNGSGSNVVFTVQTAGTGQTPAGTPATILTVSVLSHDSVPVPIMFMADQGLQFTVDSPAAGVAVTVFSNHTGS